MLKLIQEKVFEQVDGASLKAFRLSFSLLMLGDICWWWFDGRIDAYYLRPDFHFSYPFFEWVKPWSGIGVYLHMSLLIVSALCMTLGLAIRFFMILFFMGYTSVFLWDRACYQNHQYLICLVSFLLIFIPAQKAQSQSLTAWKGERSDAIEVWMLWLFRFQIGLVYFYGGVNKLSRDWLMGEPFLGWLPHQSDLLGLGSLLEEVNRPKGLHVSCLSIPFQSPSAETPHGYTTTLDELWN